LFRPGKFELGVYVGPALNNHFLGFTFGGEIGFNIGNGVLFLDGRISEFSYSGFTSRAGNSSTSLDVGYKIGVGNR
jgi:hypothetical protein